jgi:hypothetical protein
VVPPPPPPSVSKFAITAAAYVEPPENVHCGFAAVAVVCTKKAMPAPKLEPLDVRCPAAGSVKPPSMAFGSVPSDVTTHEMTIVLGTLGVMDPVEIVDAPPPPPVLVSWSSIEVVAPPANAVTATAANVPPDKVKL